VRSGLCDILAELVLCGSKKGARMPHANVGELEIYFERVGPRGNPPLLLIPGLGDQLNRWPAAFIDAIVDDGYEVILMDNRDAGLSTKLDGREAPHPIAIVQAAFTGELVEVPYTLDDLADDVALLLEALEIPRAHVLGMSMGGMIAQTLAIRHQARISSLISLMSTTGRADVALPRLDLIELLTAPPASEREDIIEQAMALRRAVQGTSHPFHDDEMRAQIIAGIERSFYPEGVARHFAAVLASGDRRREPLKELQVPTLVIHGDEDPLVPTDGGRDTHDVIAGSRFEVISGLGHDLPPSFVPVLTELVRTHLRDARARET
jgi:pimeloyl-ACP methyl ester carboxylesterase